MNNIDLRQLDTEDKYEDGNLVATISTLTSAQLHVHQLADRNH
jgi:hypothetical protein